MKNKKKKNAIAVIAVALVFAAISGCGTKNQADNNKDTLELRYWCELRSYPATLVNNLGDTPLYKKLQELTNTKISFEHPPQGQASEKFSILIASDNLPDVISYAWKGYAGGPEKAISDKLIVDLNQYKDHMPNLTKYFNENNEARMQSLTDSGQLYSCPFIRGDESLLTAQGIIIRKDWLDELGLEMPETISEWENVLTQFRDKKGAKAPLSLDINDMYNAGAFVGAYNTNLGFYIDDNGKVQYGQATQQFKQFLAKMHEWYEKASFAAYLCKER